MMSYLCLTVKDADVHLEGAINFVNNECSLIFHKDMFAESG